MAQAPTAAGAKGRIFKSDLLESLTRTHIAVPLTLFWTAGAISLWWSIARLGITWSAAVAFFLVGALFFTLVEYCMHRFMYHIPGTTEKRKRFQYVIHGVHHDHPRDKSRLALPPVVSVVLAVLFIGLFRMVIGPDGYAFGGGFLFGYSTYLLVHYCVHMYKPPKNFISVLWKHHNLHHYVGDDGAFGVSSPLWDYVLGTMPADPKRKAAAQENHLVERG
jgi:sterol desaturase/sphingolipid hydroxylase (fatty acid hydroxylase superfamily)